MITGNAVPLPNSGEVLLLDVQPCAPAPCLRPRHAGRTGAWWVTLLHAVVALALSGGAVWLRADVEARVATSLPSVPRIDVYRLVIDDTPLPVTVSAGWEKVTEWTTHEAVSRDQTLWRRMQVDDWDRVPSGLRERALESMLTRYRGVLASPATWDHMGPDDWDLVPQPIRALAFRHMAEYWTGVYDVGGAYMIPRGLMADTLAAIIMSESWFEHRAENRNDWGNRDLGVAQASDSARRRMAALYARGAVDFQLADADYFNPWYGTRFTAFWMASLLDQLNGDLGAAIRAYHRGARRALAGLGEPYERAVVERRGRFIRNAGGSAAWDYLWRRDREIRAHDWPWTTIARRSASVPLTDRSATAVILGLGLAR